MYCKLFLLPVICICVAYLSASYIHWRNIPLPSPPLSAHRLITPRMNKADSSIISAKHGEAIASKHGIEDPGKRGGIIA